MAVGLLVDGTNHFVVRGPLPSPDDASALVRRWSLIRIESGIDATRDSGCWRVSTQEFREELEWAVIVGERAPSPAVAALLEELTRRGVVVRRTPGNRWDGGT